ncbi:MAG: sigma-70 family RNA polymerase sigma factor [Gemmatimonadetes bacterium]|nr:sigma-70 family RNA polymerase sigma factor [Gemmatimonadota bacterium]
MTMGAPNPKGRAKPRYRPSGRQAMQDAAVIEAVEHQPASYARDPAGDSQEDLGAVQLYLRDAGRRRRLNGREERRCCRFLRYERWRKSRSRVRERAIGAPCARPSCLLIEGNLGLVVSIARRYQGMGLPLADLIQEGNLGLITAAARFDPARTERFPRYAAGWIRETICRALSQKSRTIRIPLDQLALRRRAASVEADLEQRYRNEECRTGRHRPHTTEDDAREIGVDPEALQATIRLVPDVESLDAPRTVDGPPLGNLLADAGSPDPSDTAARAEERDRLRDAVSHLPARLRHVVERRYGLGGAGEASLTEIGRELQVSAERVRQLQGKAMVMLSRELRHVRFPVTGNGAASNEGGIKPQI